MSKCANCGKAIAPTAKRFCNYCGTPVGAGPTKWSPRAAGARNQRLIIGGVVLGVVAIVTLVLVVLGQPRTSPDAAIGSSDSNTVSTVPTEPTPVSTTDLTSTTDEPTTTQPPADDPATVVRNFYTAVNNRDFQTAWQLGGQNLGKPYQTFVDGYATTVSDNLTVLDTNGDTVDVDLTAQWSDGTNHEYRGSYAVSNGQITSGTLQQIS